MFRISLIIIFLASVLLADTGSTSFSERKIFQYTLKENGVGSVKYVAPERSFETISAGEKIRQMIQLLLLI